jgi:hypothetical protein
MILCFYFIFIYHKMSLSCLFCQTEFTRRDNFIKHLNLNKCKSDIKKIEIFKLLESKDKIILEKDKEIKELKEKLNTVNINSPNHINHSTVQSHNNYNIHITINPIDKLNMDYIKKEDLQIMFDKLNKDQVGNMDLVLKKYIRSLISNPEHPENYAVKYTKKDPPMFSTLISENDQQICVINDLKDTCELISEPLIEQMLKKIKESWREFRQDPDFDETMDVNLLEALRSSLKNENIRKILKRYLKSDILENIDFKIEKVEPKNLPNNSL